ncbi:MAG: TetR/AcrR family transcriptional regulator [Gammaproteobacteria bacterium]
MSTKAATPEKRSARERLLTAAEELFYGEGINTVGIDRIIERAGVAKASLYDCFGSKEELIRSYLSARHESRQKRITEGLKRFATPREKLLGVFDIQVETFRSNNFRGCPFVRASAEVKPESAAKAVCDESRGWMRTLFTDLAKEAGVRDAVTLAEKLLLLYDGAAVAALMDKSKAAVASAREVAEMLVEKHLS